MDLDRTTYTVRKVVKALDDGDATRVDRLLRSLGDNFDLKKVRGQDGETLVHLAVTAPNALKLLEVLCSTFWMDCNTVANNDWTPLHIAAQKNSAEVAQFLLKHGATESLNKTDEYGETPLHQAAFKRSLEVAAVLIKYGATATTANNAGNTALHVTANRGCPKFCKLLLEEGNADPCLRNLVGETPLHYAVRENHAEVARLLCTHGGNPSALSESGLSPLHEAAELGSEDMILLFCQLPGLDTQVKDNEGRIPAEIARSNNNTRIAQMLENPEKYRKSRSSICCRRWFGLA